MLSVEQVAEQFGCCRTTVLRMVRRGKLPCVKLGKRLYRFRVSDIVAFVENGAPEAELARLSEPQSTATPCPPKGVCAPQSKAVEQ